MIKICWHAHDENDHSHVNGTSVPGTPTVDAKDGRSPRPKPIVSQPLASPSLVELRNSEPSNPSRTGTPRPATPTTPAPHIHIGAIDNSLAFPWKHPDEWRSFPL